MDVLEGRLNPNPAYFFTFFNIKFVALPHLRSLLNLRRQEMTKVRADNQ